MIHWTVSRSQTAYIELERLHLRVAPKTLPFAATFTQYQYHILLDETAGVVYKQPERQDLVIGATNTVSVVLEKIETIRLSGKVLHEQRRGVGDAGVRIEQILNGKYSKNQTVTADATGNFKADVWMGATNLTISKDRFLDLVVEDVDKQFTSSKVHLGNLTMLSLKENRVSVTLNRKSAVREGDEPASVPIVSFANLRFALRNLTQDKEITLFKAQYPYLLIDDESVRENDVIAVQATDNLGGMNASKSVFTLNSRLNGEVSVDFVENGSFAVDSVVGDNDCHLAMLFDSEDDFVARYIIEGEALESGKLTSGNYKIVLMGKSDLLTKAANIAKLSELGLVDGADYITRDVAIEDGKITVIPEVNVPKLDETELYYTKTASFTSNKTTVPTRCARYPSRGICAG